MLLPWRERYLKVLVSWFFGSLPEESTLANLGVLEPMKRERIDDQQLEI
jgi:hypothetical protein